MEIRPTVSQFVQREQHRHDTRARNLVLHTDVICNKANFGLPVAYIIDTAMTMIMMMMIIIIIIIIIIATT